MKLTGLVLVAIVLAAEGWYHFAIVSCTNKAVSLITSTSSSTISDAKSEYGIMFTVCMGHKGFIK